jgi:hypothetical protein
MTGPLTLPPPFLAPLSNKATTYVLIAGIRVVVATITITWGAGVSICCECVCVLMGIRHMVAGMHGVNGPLGPHSPLPLPLPLPPLRLPLPCQRPPSQDL